MGIFNKFFGGKNSKASSSISNQKLRLEYNVMKNISLEKCQKYENTELYELVEKGIYKDLTDESEAKYRITVFYELESEDDSNQYPLEDVLDKYYLHVSDFLESENKDNTNRFKLELGGALDDIQKSQEIIGKKVFNRDFLGADGNIRVKLVVE